MVSIGASSDTGIVRSVNQDCHKALESCAVLADGMGGHNCGEIASKMAVDIISDSIGGKKNINQRTLSDAIKKANRQIYEFSCNDPSMNGMGTTVVACLWNEKNVYIANVGDSRCYRINDGSIRQITKDHSLVQKLLDDGEISADEAAVRKDRNVLYRAVGCESDVEIDCYDLKKEKNDVYILCSDGLSNCVAESDILSVITDSDCLQTAADELVKMANKNGGYDNITVVLIKFM